MTADNHRCVPVVDADGNVIASARVSGNLDERGREALLAIVQAAIRMQQEQDAADPEAAEERGRRQASGIARIRERTEARIAERLRRQEAMLARIRARRGE